MEHPATSGRRPACDNCKDRKTKCDRLSPCSSCVGAELNCRISRRSVEKRQRVLISARYDEAMESVDRSLQEVTHAVNRLLQISERSQQQQQPPNHVPLPPSHAASSGASPAASSSHAGSSHISSNPLPGDGSTPTSTTTLVSEGFCGESSFRAHVQEVSEALRGAAAALEPARRAGRMLVDPDMLVEAAESMIAAGDETMTMPIAAADTPATTSSGGVASGGAAGVAQSTTMQEMQYPELEGRTLPPLDLVLRLLRLARAEKQRFFVDVPVIDESVFGDMCQKVYFAISDYSIWAWETVNAGIYFLLLGLDEANYEKIGVTYYDVRGYAGQLAANIDAGVRSMRLCQEPSFDACQSLAVLASFYNKLGRSGVAWQLVSAASRMCIDLGYHRLKDTGDSLDYFQKSTVFWHIFVLDKTMAFTLGRTPSIPQYDVATERIMVPQKLAGGPMFIYSTFFEYAIISGEMHLQIFSATALRLPQQKRVERAKAFASRLNRMEQGLQKNLQLNPLQQGDYFTMINALVEAVLHCLVTIAYRVVPNSGPNTSPLKSNDECTNAARKAIASILRAKTLLTHRDEMAWVAFLNMLLAVVPLACFVVLAGHTIATSSQEDLSLLSDAVSAIEPVATSSASQKKIYDICKVFHDIASESVAKKWQHTEGDEICIQQQHFDDGTGTQRVPPVEIGETQENASTFEHIMTPQDWDTVMAEIDLGVNVGQMASFVEPYMPFDWPRPFDQPKQ